MNRLADMLGLYLRVNNLSYRDVAKEIGMSASSLNRFVNGLSELSSSHLLSLLTWLTKDVKEKDK